MAHFMDHESEQCWQIRRPSDRITEKAVKGLLKNIRKIMRMDTRSPLTRGVIGLFREGYADIFIDDTKEELPDLRVYVDIGRILRPKISHLTGEIDISLACDELVVTNAINMLKRESRKALADELAIVFIHDRKAADVEAGGDGNRRTVEEYCEQLQRLHAAIANGTMGDE